MVGMNEKKMDRKEEGKHSRRKERDEEGEKVNKEVCPLREAKRGIRKG